MATITSSQFTKSDFNIAGDDMEISSDAGGPIPMDDIDVDIDVDIDDQHNHISGDDDMVDDISAVRNEEGVNTVADVQPDELMLDEDDHQMDDNEMIQDDFMFDDEELQDVNNVIEDVEITEPDRLDTGLSSDSHENAPSVLPYDGLSFQNDGEAPPVSEGPAAGESRVNLAGEGTHTENFENEGSVQDGVEVQRTEEQSEELKEVVKETLNIPGGDDESNIDEISDNAVTSIETNEFQEQKPSDNQSTNDGIASVVERETSKTDHLEEKPLLLSEDGVTGVDISSTEHDENNESADGDVPQASALDVSNQINQVSEPRPTTKQHPVLVYYEDMTMYLFPPPDSDASETYLLQDENLTRSSLKNLLHECRNVLGESVSHDYALHIEFESLGLFTSEDSAEALTMTLNDVLDIYLELCRLDQVFDASGLPHPLHVNLKPRLRMAARLSQMRASVKDGKGISHLHLLDSQDDEHNSNEQEYDSHHNSTHSTLEDEVNFAEEEPEVELEETDSLLEVDHTSDADQTDANTKATSAPQESINNASASSDETVAGSTVGLAKQTIVKNDKGVEEQEPNLESTVYWSDEEEDGNVQNGNEADEEEYEPREQVLEDDENTAGESSILPTAPANSPKAKGTRADASQEISSNAFIPTNESPTVSQTESRPNEESLVLSDSTPSIISPPTKPQPEFHKQNIDNFQSEKKDETEPDVSHGNDNVSEELNSKTTDSIDKYEEAEEDFTFLDDFEDSHQPSSHDGIEHEIEVADFELNEADDHSTEPTPPTIKDGPTGTEDVTQADRSMHYPDSSAKPVKSRKRSWTEQQDEDSLSSQGLELKKARPV